jgi:hypothetical protein
MASHCRCCSGKFVENDVLGDCPGCPECAALTTERDALKTATRKVVEALESRATFTSKDGVCFCSVRSWAMNRPHEAQCQKIRAALDDPTIVALRRE